MQKAKVKAMKYDGFSNLMNVSVIAIFLILMSAPSVKKQMAYGFGPGWMAQMPVKYIGRRMAMIHQPSFFTPIYIIGVRSDTMMRSRRNQSGILAGSQKMLRL